MSPYHIQVRPFITIIWTVVLYIEYLTLKVNLTLKMLTVPVECNVHLVIYISFYTNLSAGTKDIDNKTCHVLTEVVALSAVEMPIGTELEAGTGPPHAGIADVN